MEKVFDKGVIATADCSRVSVGNDKRMVQMGAKFTPCEASGSVVYVVADDGDRGCVVISDALKPHAKGPSPH